MDSIASVKARLPPVHLAVFFMRFSFGFVVFTLPIYLRHGSYTELGVVAAAYPAVEMIAVMVVGVVADWRGRKPMIFSGLILSSIALFSFSLTTDFRILTLIHGLQGLAAGMITVASLALIADFAHVNSRGKAMGFYDFANIGGYIVGPFLAGLIMHYYTPQTAFYAASAPALIGAALTFFFLPEPVRASNTRPTSPIQILMSLGRDRTAVAMFPIWLGMMTFLGIALTFSSRIAVEWGYSTTSTGVMFALIAFLLAFTQPFFGHLADRFGKRNLMTVGILSLLSLMLTLIIASKIKPPDLVFWPLVGIFGLGSCAFSPSALAMLADVAPERGRGITMGAYSLVMSLGTIIGPLAGGVFLDKYGVLSLYYFAAAILFGAFMISLLIFRSSGVKRNQK